MDLGAALLSAAPQLGVGGVLLALLIYLMRQASGDRGDYRAALAAAEARHAVELDRLRRAHDEEIAELSARLDAQQKQLDDLHRQLDAERRRRWRAEDIAAQARRNP